VSPVDRAGDRSERLTRILDVVTRWQVLCAVLSVPIALAAIRGVRRRYLPIGDNALIEARARDVFGPHHPMLGTWSSASRAVGLDVNHPGPLVFDLVAVPVKLLGGGPGIAFGVAAFNIALVWVIGWTAARVGGNRVAIAALAIVATLLWSLGSELLYDPWQPNLLVLTFFALLIMTWAVLAGRSMFLVPATLLASFAIQTHLSYVYLAGLLVVTSAGWVVVRAVITRNEQRLISGLRPLWWSALAGLLAWSQPLIEQFAGGADGNIARLLRAQAGAEDQTVGLTATVRVIARVVALPPWWGRSGYAEAFAEPGSVVSGVGAALKAPGFGLSLIGLGLVIVLLVALGWRYRRVATVYAAVLVVLIAMVGAVGTIARTPVDDLGLPGHRLRWLWPLAAFIGFALLLGGARFLRERWPTGGTSALVPAVGAGMTFALSVATVPFYAQLAGPVADRAMTDRARVLTEQLADLRQQGLVLFDTSEAIYADPLVGPVLAALGRYGVDYGLEEEGMIRQMGEGRRLERTADLGIVVRYGRRAHDAQDGYERIAFAPGLSAEERQELAALEATIALRLADPAYDEVLRSLPADALLDDLGDLAATGVIDLSPLLGEQTDRFIELQFGWIHRSVAVFAFVPDPVRANGG
jgi:hypothetical protein